HWRRKTDLRGIMPRSDKGSKLDRGVNSSDGQESFHRVMVLVLLHMPGKPRCRRSTASDNSTQSLLRQTRDPNREGAPAEICSVREFRVSGALSIGRFVVSRWLSAAGRGPMGIQWSVGVLWLAESWNWGRNWQWRFSRQG